MSFVYALLPVVILFAWAYVQIKTYQLCGYNPGRFFDKIIEFKFAYGDKNKLKFTRRMIRFVCAYIILIYALSVIIIEFSSHWGLILLDEIILFIFTPLEILLVHYILLPLEICIKRYYMGKAEKKLIASPCIKIGITGSFGKTTTKNILAEILGKEYKVCVTPQSYNTEMGVTKTVLERLDDEDVFIAEMGARKSGDIEILTKLVKPNYAIITAIGLQHLESFGSLDNIEHTKFELLKYMGEGSAVINGSNASGLKLYKWCKIPKFLTCKEGSYAYAKDVKLNSEGSSFTMVLDGRELKCKTKLLGQCNIDNIVSASALASIMKICDKDIIDAISQLEPSSHRLELINGNGVTIIDDSYNSNLIGAREALKVLAMFEGKKIVVTPGIVEMGEQQAEVNFQLGAAIADVADYVIVMNEENKNYLLSGLISHSFSQNCVYFAQSRTVQKDLLKKIMSAGAVVLFENDLPDDYK